MPEPKSEDREFIESVRAVGVTATARKFDMDTRCAFRRRRTLERIYNTAIGTDKLAARSDPQFAGRLHIEIPDGIVLIGSDAHYWPGLVSTAHRGFVKACELLRPKAVIMNGDVLDGASVSRHPPIGWEKRPSLIDEIEACQARLGEIKAAAGAVGFYWTLGNHDARFETRLASVAPEYARIHGVHLQDHFPGWEPAWSVWINESVVVKHRYRNGIHAAHNNTVNSGKSIVTGHLHSLKVTPFSDLNGDRFGVDCGTLSTIGGPQFQDYLEDNPVNWRSGFVVLTFSEGRLLWPEVAHVLDEAEGAIEFRGKIWRV